MRTSAPPLNLQNLSIVHTRPLLISLVQLLSAVLLLGFFAVEQARAYTGKQPITIEMQAAQKLTHAGLEALAHMLTEKGYNLLISDDIENASIIVDDTGNNAPEFLLLGFIITIEGLAAFCDEFPEHCVGAGFGG